MPRLSKAANARIVKKMFSKAGLRKARAYNRRRRVPRTGVMPKMTTGHFASRQEQFSIAVTAGVVYDFSTSLNDLTPCKTLASLYQYYRITSVELRFKPAFDTFIAGGAAGTGVMPYLNFQYDKSGDLAGTMNAANFEQLGTKSIRLDDKTLVRKWRPSVITQDALAQTTQFKVSPWMPTHDPVVPTTLNIVKHLGAVFYISKINPADASVYDVDVVVNVQFRKPYIAPSSSITGGNPPRAIQTEDGLQIITGPSV